MADPDFPCERARNGGVHFPIEGVPLFGHDTPLRIFIDPHLLAFDEVWAATGTWTDVFPIAPDLLAQASGAPSPISNATDGGVDEAGA